MLVVSVLIAVGITIFMTLFFKKFASFTRFPVREIGLILLTSYFSYLFTEHVGFSGIIAVFICGVLMGSYTVLNVSQESKKFTFLFFETTGHLSESLVFSYMGNKVS